MDTQFEGLVLGKESELKTAKRDLDEVSTRLEAARRENTDHDLREALETTTADLAGAEQKEKDAADAVEAASPRR